MGGQIPFPHTENAGSMLGFLAQSQVPRLNAAISKQPPNQAPCRPRFEVKDEATTLSFPSVLLRENTSSFAQRHHLLARIRAAHLLSSAVQYHTLSETKCREKSRPPPLAESTISGVATEARGGQRPQKRALRRSTDFGCGAGDDSSRARPRTQRASDHPTAQSMQTHNHELCRVWWVGRWLPVNDSVSAFRDAVEALEALHSAARVEHADVASGGLKIGHAVVVTLPLLLVAGTR